MPTTSFYASMMQPWRQISRMNALVRDSVQVVNVRTRKIVEASIDPLTGDYAELNMMIPEKVEAFTKSATIMSAELIASQSEFMNTWFELAGLALRSGGPSALETRKAAMRSAKIFTRSLRITDRAMVPIEKKARSNARRLK